MKQPLLIILCLSLCLFMNGCKKAEIESARKENSAGSGYGVAQKSSISLNDLYFFSVNTTKEQVLSALGSPQKYTIASEGAVTYILDSGATLQLTYNQRDVVKSAVYTDESGKEQSLFTLLVNQQVLESEDSASKNQNTGVGNQAEEAKKEEEKKPVAGQKPSGEQKPSANQKPSQNKNPSVNSAAQTEIYFASENYSIDIASKLLEVGAKRKKIISALGKPHAYGSVSFKKDSYLIDVYHMEDGSIYYLDYGYEREALRAVRAVKGSRITNLLGSWGQAEKPKDIYYDTRNLTAFSSLKKGAKPVEVYRRYGEPNWYEGNETSYKDAYQLMGGAILYLDFGSGHGNLISAMVRQKDGSMVPFTLR